MDFSRKITLLTAIIITTTLAVPAIGQPERGIEVGQKIEPRQVSTLEREKRTLPDEEGLTVLLFWSTWSPRSSSALQIWQRYEEQYRDHGITVVAVNAENQRMEEDDVRKITRYVEENGVTLPVVLDTGLELYNEIGVIVLPTTLIFKPDGTLDYKYPGLPSSAELDLKEDLEAKLGIAAKPEMEEDPNRGKLEYQPRNNALLFFNMGVRLHEKGFPEKAKAKYIEALQKDPDYADPLRALEDLFFARGRTDEARERLKVLLTSSGLESVVDDIRMEPPEPEAGPPSAPEEQVQADQGGASAATPAEKKLTPMERMKLLMEGGE